MNHKKNIAALQGIAIDSINNAGQGHAGMAIGAAPITYSLIGNNLNFVKENPKWINRDRFILSAGHGSMAHYSILHFFGMLSVNDMKAHKKLNSKTPSHPEIDKLDYVDASTGPLGQGIAMGVGMAMSLSNLKKRFNKPNYNVFDHDIFVLHGDGCIQEGVALEAIQLAGTLKLSNLILIHDFNEIQIDSKSNEVNDIDFVKYMKSQNFKVIVVKKPTFTNIDKAIKKARKSNKPTYIRIKTLIATNTKNENKSSGHNFTLDENETKEFKIRIGLQDLKPFSYSQSFYDEMQLFLKKKNQKYKEWIDMFKEYKTKYKKEWLELDKQINEKIKYDFNIKIERQNVATREYVIDIMNYLSKYKNIVVGSADLVAATKVKISKLNFIKGGQDIKFGIREFAMTAIANGIYLHSKARTITSTFLSFSDYSKPAIRLGAIMHIPSIYVFTHDSYQVGGDGPTHQPIDQLPMLRAIDNVEVIRPCDSQETILAFKYALNQNQKQIAIILSRQPFETPNIDKGKKLKPAYRVFETSGKNKISILATGSEVELAISIAKILKETKNVSSQVISVPLLQHLIDNDKLIKELKIDKIPIFAIEASSDNSWYKLSKYNKIETHLSKKFGDSALGLIVYEKHGFNSKNIVNSILKFLKKIN